jgi:hypothetical protein
LMSAKNKKNLIVVVSVAAALLAGTILLGGYANSAPADNEAPAKACQAEGKMAGCPMMAQTAGCPKMAGAEMASTDGSATPCTTGCPKPCCAEEGCCETPCPIPCPKPCCAEGGCCAEAEKAGCCSVETAVQ